MSEELKPCPFCGEKIEPPKSRQASTDRSEGFVAFAACYCGGYSATAHKMGRGNTEAEAIQEVIALWNRRAQPAEVEGVEAVEFWVLFDATTPEPYIKKMMPEGFLAFFDHEEDAIRAKTFHLGTDYKRVPYVRQSAHLAALSAVTAERGALKHALDVKEEFYQDALHSHIVLARQVNQLRAKLEALQPVHAMILNALDRDAEEGKTARGEMAAELRAAMAAKEA